jgi:hypothetical protein
LSLEQGITTEEEEEDTLNPALRLPVILVSGCGLCNAQEIYQNPAPQLEVVFTSTGFENGLQSL